jgi:hypothetical protein
MGKNIEKTENPKNQKKQWAGFFFNRVFSNPAWNSVRTSASRLRRLARA